MENLINIWITSAEDRWLEKLHLHAKNLFEGIHLPSHDHTHHRRVWNICTALLNEVATFNSAVDQTLVEGLLIATYFHDLGMVRSTGEEHGTLSRDICETYFLESPDVPPAGLKQVLDAIEKHDVKDGKISSVFEAGASPSILELLSVADDLEALGTIGIYRYTEIYLMRDVSFRNLGIRILGNVSNRFKNILIRCENCPKLLLNYRQQYSDLVSFFDNYNQQLLTEQRPETVFSGHLGVVNYIRSLGIEECFMPGEFVLKTGTGNTSHIITNYFSALKHELEQERL